MTSAAWPDKRVMAAGGEFISEAERGAILTVPALADRFPRALVAPEGGTRDRCTLAEIRRVISS